MASSLGMSDEKSPAVYLLASRRNGTLYIGVTSALCRRVTEHRQGLIPGFTRKYGVKLLVWFEAHPTMEEAIKREKQMKEWKRAWKIELIENSNPEWRDLYAGECEQTISDFIRNHPIY
jgi:putative endonuclease